MLALCAEGHTTLVVSTDPAHSLSDSLDQDVSGGRPVQVEGTDLPVWGMEIDADEARQRFQASSAEGKSQVTATYDMLAPETFPGAVGCNAACCRGQRTF